MPEPESELEVLHCSAGRLRVRARALKGQPDALAALATLIMEWPHVLDATVNPVTGSILILHDVPDSGSLLTQLGAFDALRMTLPAPLSLGLASRLANVGRVLERSIGGAVDLRGVGVLGLLAMAVTQIARGSLAVPATTALWYALQLLLETGRGQDRSLND